MFGRKKEEKSTRSMDIDSLIGENLVIKGKIKGSGNIRIDGRVEGDIDYDGDISLGETGKIIGDVCCDNLTAAGSINGNIKVKDSFVLLSSGVLIGDMEIKSLVIHEDAKFEGSCKMMDAPSNVKKLNADRLNKKEEAR